MNKQLPTYKSTKLTGPTAVARRTEPTVHVYDGGAKYYYRSHRDIRETFRKFGKTPVDTQTKGT